MIKALSNILFCFIFTPALLLASSDNSSSACTTVLKGLGSLDYEIKVIYGKKESLRNFYINKLSEVEHFEQLMSIMRSFDFVTTIYGKTEAQNSIARILPLITLKAASFSADNNVELQSVIDHMVKRFSLFSDPSFLITLEQAKNKYQHIPAILKTRILRLYLQLAKDPKTPYGKDWDNYSVSRITPAYFQKYFNNVAERVFFKNNHLAAILNQRLAFIDPEKKYSRIEVEKNFSDLMIELDKIKFSEYVKVDGIRGYKSGPWLPFEYGLYNADRLAAVLFDPAEDPLITVENFRKLLNPSKSYPYYTSPMVAIAQGLGLKSETEISAFLTDFSILVVELHFTRPSWLGEVSKRDILDMLQGLLYGAENTWLSN